MRFDNTTKAVCVGLTSQRLLALACLFCFAHGLAVSIGHAQDVQTRFLTEAPKGWRILDEWDRGLEFTASVKAIIRREKQPAAPLDNEELTFRYRSANGSCLVDATFRPTDKGQPCLAFGVNPRYSFILGRNKKDVGKWTVRMLNVHGEEEQVRQEIASRFGGYIHPATHHAFHLADLIASKDFAISAADAVSEGKKEFVKVSCAYSLPKQRGDNDVRRRRGWMLFDPENNWALVEFSMELIGAGQWHRKLEFQDHKIGNCRPYAKLTMTNSTPTWAVVWQVAYDAFTHRDIPENEFALASFGLPEILGGASKTKASRWWLLFGLFSISALFLVIAVLVRRWRPSATRAQGTVVDQQVGK